MLKSPIFTFFNVSGFGFVGLYLNSSSFFDFSGVFRISILMSIFVLFIIYCGLFSIIVNIFIFCLFCCFRFSFFVSYYNFLFWISILLSIFILFIMLRPSDNMQKLFVIIANISTFCFFPVHAVIHHPQLYLPIFLKSFDFLYWCLFRSYL